MVVTIDVEYAKKIEDHDLKWNQYENVSKHLWRIKDENEGDIFETQYFNPRLSLAVLSETLH